jgi:hypothetical protein
MNEETVIKIRIKIKKDPFTKQTLPSPPPIDVTIYMLNKKERVKRLREHLAMSKAKHEETIMLMPTLKEAHAYCVIHGISSQQYGPLLEQYIRRKFNFEKVKAEECKGDCSKDGNTSEIKVSLGGATHTKFNFVQLRPSHDCDTYILTAYHLTYENAITEGELYVFKIPKAEMTHIIAQHGGYAHGTIKEHGQITRDSICIEGNMKEYAIRPNIHDECWKKLLAFRINESEL